MPAFRSSPFVHCAIGRRVRRKPILDPNYDFCAIFSDKEFRIIRVGVPDNKPETINDNLAHFRGVDFAIRMAEGEALADSEAIFHATRGGRVLNGRTTIADPAGRYTAMLEFPIKTINVYPKPSYIYQVDTGPVALPDFALQKPRWVERFRLAFVAYQKPGEVYFISQVPTPVNVGQADSPQVRHYSAIERMDSQNRVIALR